MATPNDNLDPQNLPMMRRLPWPVLNRLRDHFYAGVTAAEIRFEFNAADEDALTGALIHSLVEPSVVTLQTDTGVFGVQVTARKLRGRGPAAPEKSIGADGIFQLEIFDETGNLMLRKGLLFQAKVDWSDTDARLLAQAEILLEQSPSSIVIDYTSGMYHAIAASDVVAVQGNRRRLRRSANGRLAEVLGDQFVSCIRGDLGLYWDATSERLITHDQQPSDLVPSYLVDLSVRRIQ